MTNTRQFALPFPQDDTFEPNAFLSGSANEAALAWIENPDRWPGGRLAIVGEAGVGKTHLLHLFAHRHGAAVLSIDQLGMFMPLPDTKCLAIDNADANLDERVLLHVLNSASESGKALLLSGRSAPAHWDIRLPDLVSRLRALIVVGLGHPDDALLQSMLCLMLAERQLCVSDRLQAYMLLHLPRNGGALRQAVAHLDRLALGNGGHVTREMANRVIEAAKPPETLASIHSANPLLPSLEV